MHCNFKVSRNQDILILRKQNISMCYLHCLFKTFLVSKTIQYISGSWLIVFELKTTKLVLCPQDWSYRDIIPPVQTYSLKQRDYFATLPARRFDLLESWGFLAKEKDQAAEGLDSDHHLNGHG